MLLCQAKRGRVYVINLICTSFCLRRKYNEASQFINLFEQSLMWVEGANLFVLSILDYLEIRSNSTVLQSFVLDGSNLETPC